MAQIRELLDICYYAMKIDVWVLCLVFSQISYLVVTNEWLYVGANKRHKCMLSCLFVSTRNELQFTFVRCE